MVPKKSTIDDYLEPARRAVVIEKFEKYK